MAVFSLNTEKKNQFQPRNNADRRIFSAKAFSGAEIYRFKIWKHESGTTTLEIFYFKTFNYLEILQGNSEFPEFRFRSSNIRRKSSSHGVSPATNLVTKNRFASKDRFASTVMKWDNNKNEKIFWKFISAHFQSYFLQFYMDLEMIIYIIWVFHDVKMSLFELKTSIVWCNSWKSISYGENYM